MKTFSLSIKETVVIICISFLFLSLAVHSAYTNHVFDDEPTHLSAGYTKLILRDYRMHTESPPIMQAFAALPLTFLNIDSHTDSEYWKTKNMVLYSCLFLFKNSIDSHLMLFAGRLPGILLGIILGILLFFFTAKIYNKLTGFVVFALFATYPMMITHASVVYVDFGFMFFNFLTFMVLLLFLQNQKTKYLYAFFVLFSITFLTKFSSIHNFILYPIILAINYKKTSPWFIKNKKSLWKYFLSAAAIFYAVILLVYAFQVNFSSLSASLQNDQFIAKDDPKLDAAQKLFESNYIIKFVSSLPNPFPYALVKGIGYWIFDARTQENKSVLTPLKTIFVKNTVMILLLALFSIFSMFLKTKKYAKQKWFNAQFLYYVLFFILIFSIFGSYSYARYFLMVYPFILLLSARTISLIFESNLNKMTKYSVIALILLAHIIEVFMLNSNLYDFQSLFSIYVGYVQDLSITNLAAMC